MISRRVVRCDTAPRLITSDRPELNRNVEKANDCKFTIVAEQSGNGSAISGTCAVHGGALLVSMRVSVLPAAKMLRGAARRIK